jgi:hypothetical protein
MPLAVQASNQIPAIPGFPAVAITCHVAVWYWAAKEAQALGRTGAKTAKDILERIVAMPDGPQRAMLALRYTHTADYAGRRMPPLPPAGTVLRWNTGATHAAVVTGPDAITGYNQLGFLQNVAAFVHTTAHRADFHPSHTMVYLIPEATIVNAAGRFDL